MTRAKHNKVIITCLLAILFVAACKQTEQNRNRIKKGDFSASLTESGELQAIRFEPVIMPFIGWKYGWRFKIIGLEEHGSLVNKGDTVVRVDPSPVIQALEDEKSRLVMETANLEKILISHQSQISQLEAERESEKANYELIKLQVERFSFEPENKQKLKALELKIAEERLNRIEKKYEMLREVNSYDSQIQQVRIAQIKRNIQEAKWALEKLNILSPIDGLYELPSNRRTRSMIQPGDEINQGQLIASIPDMSKMKVSTTVLETDIAKVHMNQEVIIRLDAYPGKPFTGYISYIGSMSREKGDEELMKVFDIDVTLKDSDPVLKPGMTVSCEIITHELKEVHYIENDCVFRDSSQYYLISAGSGKQVKTAIEILARNNHYSALKGDFEEGQRFLSRDELNVINEDN